MKNPIIVLTGPTASGKTAMSFTLASKYKGEIICADSMTVYRGMDIGTDKPILLEKVKPIREADGSYVIKGIRHHLLDILDPNEEFNAAIFKEKAASVISDIRARGHVPILVGGSLLYIDSLIYDFKMPAVAPNPKLRAELEVKSNEELFRELVALDPDAEWVVDAKNKRRLIRALEVCLALGKPFTTSKSKKPLPDNVLYLAVEREREELYGRINSRVDEMMSEGFLEEVKSLGTRYDSNSALQATGYRQLAEYLAGQTSLSVAVEETKKSHRNFAKRQLSWLRGNPDVIYVPDAETADRAVQKFLSK